MPGLLGWAASGWVPRRGPILSAVQRGVWGNASKARGSAGGVGSGDL